MSNVNNLEAIVALGTALGVDMSGFSGQTGAEAIDYIADHYTAPVSGGGFDCIIKTDTLTWADATLTLVAGDFASAYAKLTAGTPIVACVQSADEYGGCGVPNFVEAEIISGDNPGISLSNAEILGSGGAISWTADGVEFVAN